MSASAGFMTVVRTLVVFFTLAATQVTGDNPPSTLRHVNLVFRHGDRSPSLIFPSDVNQLNAWPDGLGWLTNIGKEQQYQLGKYLRQRYGGFINVSRYDHRQISVQSSAKDRCIMSALSNLAGLFPPQGDQLWNSDDLKWQPIPVKSVPEQEDNKIAITAPCPRYDQLYTQVFSSPIAMDYQKKNQAFFDMLSRNTGWTEPSTVTTTWKIIDPVVAERAHNMTLNGFLLKDGVLDKLDEIQHFTWDLLYHTREMARLKGGPLLKEMIDNMKAAAEGKAGDLKFHFYSGHDSTVSALLRAMTVNNHLQPPYNSLVMVELHRENSQDLVKIYYRNDTDSDPSYLVPGGCEDPCKLSTFQKVLANSIPQNWAEECKGIHNYSPSLQHSAFPLALTFILMTIKALTFF